MSAPTTGNRRSTRGLLAGLCATCVCAVCAGCSVEKKDVPLAKAIRADVAVTHEQMRLRMRSLVEPMCGRIEHAADELAAGTTDPDVRLAALKWKMDAVPALREALFQPEPFAAAFDALVLINQMIDYFETGAGRHALGSAAEQAAAACRAMEEDLSAVLAGALHSGDMSKVRDATKKWAAAHPIRHAISDRESAQARADRKSTRLNSSHLVISYAVFCLKKKNSNNRASQLLA